MKIGIIGTPYLILTAAIFGAGLFIWLGVKSPNIKPATTDTLVVIRMPVYVDSAWKNSVELGTNSFPPQPLFTGAKTRDTVYELKIIWK